MSDKSLRDVDSVSEKTPVTSNAAVMTRPADHAVLRAEKERQNYDFKNLKDDFGKHWFPPSQNLLHGNRDDMRVHDEDEQARRDEMREHRDLSRVARIERAGQRKGAADIAAVASVQSVGTATTLAELLQVIDRVQQIALIGEKRADRLAWVLDKRNGNEAQEGMIKNQIAAVKAEKLNGVARMMPVLVQKAKEERGGGHDGGDAGGRAGGDAGGRGGRGERRGKRDAENENESKIEKLIQFKMVSDKELRERAHEISKDFAAWAESREIVGLLGNRDKAVDAMDSLVQKARDGNPAARDALAATLVSGNAADSWLIAKRGDFNGVQRPIAIPNLPPELSTDLKLQAAKGLISIGEFSALTRSEQMALAMVMGEAFSSRMNGDKSAANNQLLSLTVKHFLKTFAADPMAAQSQQEREATVAKLTRAMGGMVEAVRSNVRGAACLREFINQVMVGDDKTVRISPFVKQNSLFAKPDGEPNVAGGRSGRTTSDLRTRVLPAQLGEGGLAAGAGGIADSAFRSMLEMMKGERRKEDKRAGAPRGGAGVETRGGVTRANELRDSMKRTFRIGERKDFIELESGRYYDPVLRRFFARQGDLLVEDSNPATERERCEIALASSNKQDRAVFVQAPSAPPTQQAANNPQPHLLRRSENPSL